MLVGDDLHLDVTRSSEVALDVALVSPEALQRLGLGRGQSFVGVGRGVDHPHAAPAAAVSGLDRDGPSVGLAEGDHLVAGAEELGGPGHARNPGLLGRDPAGDLVSHDLDGFGGRTDEGHAPFGDGAGEVGVLGEEPVAGVDAVGTGTLDDLEDLVGVEVALGRGLTAEGVGLVGQTDVEGVAVEVGVDRHGGDTQFLAGTDDPDGDLAPVGDQDLGQHEGHV